MIISEGQMDHDNAGQRRHSKGHDEGSLTACMTLMTVNVAHIALYHLQ